MLQYYQMKTVLKLYERLARGMRWKYAPPERWYRGKASIEGKYKGKDLKVLISPTGNSETGLGFQLSFGPKSFKYAKEFVAVPKAKLWGLMYSKKRASNLYNRLLMRGAKEHDTRTHKIVTNDLKYKAKEDKLKHLFLKEKELLIYTAPHVNYFATNEIKNHIGLLVFLDDLLDFIKVLQD